jgi:hypothetical protein
VGPGRRLPPWRGAQLPGRRRFLRLTAGAGLALGTGCATNAGSPAPGDPAGVVPTPSPSPSASPPLGIRTPKVNGGINVHPLRRLGAVADEEVVIDPQLVALQMSAVYQLGFDGMRITVPLVDEGAFLAAIPYVRSVRALGIDAVVVLSDFAGLYLAQGLHESGRRAEILQLYTTVFATPPEPVPIGVETAGPRAVGRIAFEVLNEPTHFLGIPPAAYVHEFLGPCYNWFKSNASREVIVVSAAEVGNLDGPARERAMLEAGVESVADRIAYHIYSEGVIPLLSDHVRRLVWVTESGIAGTALHLPWVRDTFPRILGEIGDASRIFYYDLYDPDPGVYRLFDIRQEGGTHVPVAESGALYAFLDDNVNTAVAGRPLLGFDTLVPDIRVYFPTPADIAAYEQVRGIGARA